MHWEHQTVLLFLKNTRVMFSSGPACGGCPTLPWRVCFECDRDREKDRRGPECITWFFFLEQQLPLTLILYFLLKLSRKLDDRMHFSPLNLFHYKSNLVSQSKVPKPPETHFVGVGSLQSDSFCTRPGLGGLKAEGCSGLWKKKRRNCSLKSRGRMWSLSMLSHFCCCQSQCFCLMKLKMLLCVFLFIFLEGGEIIIGKSVRTLNKGNVSKTPLPRPYALEPNKFKYLAGCMAWGRVQRRFFELRRWKCTDYNAFMSLFLYFLWMLCPVPPFTSHPELVYCILKC